jgi:ABC-type branched-subunit amino acid transport system substrate-binding protein
LLVLGLAQTACSEPEPKAPENAITIGALLPFTGKEAAIGRNLEQALLLAVRDVNEAGGVDGRPLELITRDSNSGSERGFDELLQLLYTDKVQYLVGPEETELANVIVPDIKGLNMLDLLPGYAAPSIEQTGARGGWVRLAPTAGALACGMARHVFNEGTRTINTLATVDDYNTSLATDFSSEFGTLRGQSLPSVSVPVGATSYLRQVNQVFSYGAERTVLIAHPAAASSIATEWTIVGRRGSWYLSPLLHAEVFLQNIPFGTLNGTEGLSPSLSLASECRTTDGDALTCTRDNAKAFSDHFAQYWEGEHPFPAAHFYYDAVVLLALGLQAGLTADGVLPQAHQLRDYIRKLGEPDAQPVRWGDLRGPMTEVRLGTAVRYVGAGAEYQFDGYGAAEHSVYDTWSISDDAFIDTGSIRAVCNATF